MDVQEFLDSFRETRKLIMRFEYALDVFGNNGSPNAIAQMSFQHKLETNEKAFRMAQRYEFLCQHYQKEKESYDKMVPIFESIQKKCPNLKMKTILERYYFFGDTDQQIGEFLSMSTRQVNRLRLSAVENLREYFGTVDDVE